MDINGVPVTTVTPQQVAAAVAICERSCGPRRKPTGEQLKDAGFDADLLNAVCNVISDTLPLDILGPAGTLMLGVTVAAAHVSIKRDELESSIQEGPLQPTV